MSRLVGTLLLFIGAALAQNTYHPTSFCERYATALFGDASATSQANLITAVIGRALNGNTTVTTPAVTGILNQELQKPFFNGTRGTGTNYYTDATARTQLVNKLINFFEVAMKCRAVTTTAVANMKTVHAVMGIDKPVWDQFVNEVVNTLVSYGVNNDGTVNSDITYAAALLGQFLKNSTQEICSGPACLAATGFGEFTTGTDANGLRWWGEGFTDTVTIPLNGYIHWNLNPSHNVVQVDSTFTTETPSGFTSGDPATTSARRSYTRQFTTAGTYYFYCRPHKTLMKATIVVTSGTTTASSTGSSPAASGYQVSAVAVLLSIAASVVALRRVTRV